ncbi:hypothetical protein GNI_143920 [Gregarina niphandrodes]|uniref:Uncharacterized protein n=1 Tax=Gregarina niphandrodes TaxID=110365 RepID=A0A023AZX4_GRENI|nr:hypothetical protein GNI_143920 [Gregarina niphandrodes]EZG44768.1 hypothetical protein GNI_143920 [Gregarina niphandrodes]|eukprot:XP_011134121.1 hypothetical protein GNI_143920 [Gregarina niphandrodes]
MSVGSTYLCGAVGGKDWFSDPPKLSDPMFSDPMFSDPMFSDPKFSDSKFTNLALDFCNSDLSFLDGPSYALDAYSLTRCPMHPALTPGGTLSACPPVPGPPLSGPPLSGCPPSSFSSTEPCHASTSWVTPWPPAGAATPRSRGPFAGPPEPDGSATIYGAPSFPPSPHPAPRHKCLTPRTSKTSTTYSPHRHTREPPLSTPTERTTRANTQIDDRRLDPKPNRSLDDRRLDDRRRTGLGWSLSATMIRDGCYDAIDVLELLAASSKWRRYLNTGIEKDDATRILLTYLETARRDVPSQLLRLASIKEDPKMPLLSTFSNPDYAITHRSYHKSQHHLARRRLLPPPISLSPCSFL